MKYIINGGVPLQGSVAVSSAKNALLVQMASALLVEGVTTISNVDKIHDVLVMIQLLQHLGCDISWQGDSIAIDATHITTSSIPIQLAEQMRASIFLLGALLGRVGSACTYMPGGCAIGARPIDIHIDVLHKLGVDTRFIGRQLTCRTDRLVGSDITLRMPSVGATENAMMCAVLAQGSTILHNCAIEPEVVALANSLVQMGAHIEGIGSRDITIDGVDRLHGVDIEPISDRIVAGTYIVAGCMTEGDITVTNVNLSHIEPLLDILSRVGVGLIYGDNSLRIISNGYKGLGYIETAPYPMFPTDMQSLVLSMATLGHGSCTIVEKLFEDRLLSNCSQLASMGADVSLNGCSATIVGVEALSPTQLRCTDLRGGAGLVLACLATRGTSVVDDIHHIQRGYYKFHDRLVSLGADISVID